MYQNNIKLSYNRHYGKAKPGSLDSPSKMLQNKKMLQEESEDEFTSNPKLDEEQKLMEQKFGKIMFLVTALVLLANLCKAASEWGIEEVPQFLY